jgi:hypothetical protein
MTAFFLHSRYQNQTKMTRKKIPGTTLDDVLVTCRRRCAMCFGLHKQVGIVKGQIAHLDHDNTNDELDNLAFLCLPHHDEYDSKYSQSKRWTIGEVKKFRGLLYSYLESMPIDNLNLSNSSVLLSTPSLPMQIGLSPPVQIATNYYNFCNNEMTGASSLEVNKVDVFLSKYANLFTYLFMKREDLGHSIEMNYIQELDELRNDALIERIRSEPIKTLQETLWKAVSGLLGVYGSYQHYMTDTNRIRFDNKNSTQAILQEKRSKAKKFVETIEDCYYKLDNLVAEGKNRA